MADWVEQPPHGKGPSSANGVPVSADRIHSRAMDVSIFAESKNYEVVDAGKNEGRNNGCIAVAPPRLVPSPRYFANFPQSRSVAD